MKEDILLFTVPLQKDARGLYTKRLTLAGPRARKGQLQRAAERAEWITE